MTKVEVKSKTSWKPVIHYQSRSLKKLTEEYLKKSIQNGAHSSVDDARASMGLYRLQEKEWEEQRSYADIRDQMQRDISEI